MSDDNKQDGAEPSPASAGSVAGDRVAWLVIGDGYEYATLLKEHAEVIAEEEDGVVIPLYRKPQPTLTDEEVEAVEWCIFQQAVPQKTAVTMRRMLERLK